MAALAPQTAKPVAAPAQNGLRAFTIAAIISVAVVVGLLLSGVASSPATASGDTAPTANPSIGAPSLSQGISPITDPTYPSDR